MIEKIRPLQRNGHLGNDAATSAVQEMSRTQILDWADSLGLKIKKRWNEKEEPESHYRIILPRKSLFQGPRIIFHGWALDSIEALRHAKNALESEQAKLLPESIYVQRDWSDQGLIGLLFGRKYDVRASNASGKSESVVKGRFNGIEHAEEKARKKIASINKKRSGQKNG